jgi:hypothetical protein
MTDRLGISIARGDAGLQVAITPPAPSPVAAMMLGKPAEEVAALMPRLFNLCGVAQGLAVRLALDLPVEGSDPRREILRDHLAKLCLRWPGLMGLTAQPLPADWPRGGPELRAWIWDSDRPARLEPWLESGKGISPVLRAIAQRFAPGEAVADLPAWDRPMCLSAQENSPAMRVCDDPLMAQAEAIFGRGPLWRALGRVIDLDRLCAAPPLARRHGPGLASVAAARGTYTLALTLSEGRVSALQRITPTDHLVASGGMLQLSLESLPAHKVSLAGLVVDILDPCVPVEFREVADA